MEFLLLIYGDEKAYQAMSETEVAAVHKAYGEYSAAMAEAGVMRGGAELAPFQTAKTVRVRNQTVTATDGPFAETKEQLGGYYLIDTPTMEAALAWAARCPSAQGGSIEVRALVK